MKMDVIRISISLETGKEISRKKIGERKFTEEQIGSMAVRMLTGKSVGEVYQEIVQEQLTNNKGVFQ